MQDRVHFLVQGMQTKKVKSLYRKARARRQHHPFHHLQHQLQQLQSCLSILLFRPWLTISWKEPQRIQELPRLRINTLRPWLRDLHLEVDRLQLHLLQLLHPHRWLDPPSTPTPTSFSRATPWTWGFGGAVNKENPFNTHTRSTAYKKITISRPHQQENREYRRCWWRLGRHTRRVTFRGFAYMVYTSFLFSFPKTRRMSQGWY